MPHEQVLRGVPAQAVLRGPAGHRPGRGAREGARRRAVPAEAGRARPRGRPARQRPAVLRQPGQPGRLLRVRARRARRSWGSGSPAAGTSPTGGTCRSRASTSRASPTACARRTGASTSTRSGAWRRSTSRRSSGAGRRAYARTLDFPAFRVHRGRGRRDPRGGHRAHLGPRRDGRAPLPGGDRGRRHVDDAQDVPRPARRDDPLQEGRTRRPSTGPSSRASRAARTTT